MRFVVENDLFTFRVFCLRQFEKKMPEWLNSFIRPFLGAFHFNENGFKTHLPLKDHQVLRRHKKRFWSYPSQWRYIALCFQLQSKHISYRIEANTYTAEEYRQTIYGTFTKDQSNNWTIFREFSKSLTNQCKERKFHWQYGHRSQQSRTNENISIGNQFIHIGFFNRTYSYLILFDLTISVVSFLSISSRRKM